MRNLKEISMFFLAVCIKRCGPLGRCIRPNICLCEGGTVASSCSSSQTKGERIIFINFREIEVFATQQKEIYLYIGRIVSHNKELFSR